MQTDTILQASSGAAPVAMPLPSKEVFRSSMAKLAAAVNIITTDGPAGKAGITVTAMCSLTDEPPMVIVCLNRQARANQLAQANGCLAVNILGERCQELSAIFSGQRGLDMEARFETGARWSTEATGSPVLEESVCSLDCEISQSVEIGTHTVLYCRIVAIRHFDEDKTLLYHDRQYKSC
jgi:flavin reductase